jgi:hypothetical protein
MSHETLAPARVWSVRPKPDRRRQRIPVSPCETCGETRVAIASRTDYVVYFRCPDCRQFWSVPKPGREPRSGSFTPQAPVRALPAGR